MDYGSIHYVHTSAASITRHKTGCNSSALYARFPLLFLLRSPSQLQLQLQLQLPPRVSLSGNGARYLQRVIRKATTAATATAHRQAVHVFIRFPIKRKIFQFWCSNFCRRVSDPGMHASDRKQFDHERIWSRDASRQYLLRDWPNKWMDRW